MDHTLSSARQNRSASRTRRHCEAVAVVFAPPAALFAHLDDPTRLGGHMEKSSMMMGGGRMTYEFDEGRGQVVGSHIRMGGSAFGLKLFVDEVVTEREPPRCKVWRTAGRQRLIAMEGYEMGFDIEPKDGGSRLKVWIDYDLGRGLGRWLPALAGIYARWCVDRMVEDAVAIFGTARKRA
jgi:hypothetical protein